MTLPLSLLPAVLLTLSPVELQKGVTMTELNACPVELASEAINQGRWGGRIAVYDLVVAADGTVASMNRRVINEREHLIRLVKIEQLERCVRRGRFARAGRYTLSLLGGTVIGDGRQWIVDVQGNGGRRRILLPLRPPPA